MTLKASSGLFAVRSRYLIEKICFKLFVQVQTIKIGTKNKKNSMSLHLRAFA